jgi:hypothetical protein
MKSAAKVVKPVMKAEKVVKPVMKSAAKVVKPVMKAKKPPHPEGCALQTTKKYLTRPSPPYPANECCGMTMIGNDGNSYTSKRRANNICAWSLNAE